jgi:chromosome segregation ATPase
MKTLHLVLIIVIAAVILFTVMEVKSCVKEERATETAELKGQLEAHQEALRKAEAEREEADRRAELELARLREEKAELLNDVIEIREKDAKKAAAIVELEDQLSEMVVPTEIETHPAYINMVSQRDKWQERFYLMEEDRDKFVDLLATAEKETAEERGKAARAAAQVVELQTALGKAIETIDSLERKGKSTRFWGEVEKYFGYGGWALFGLSAANII